MCTEPREFLGEVWGGRDRWELHREGLMLQRDITFLVLLEFRNYRVRGVSHVWAEAENLLLCGLGVRPGCRPRML